MKRIFCIAAALLLAGAAVMIPVSRTTAAGQQHTCPPAPAPGSSVNGGLLVTGPCTLSNVTVNGGATVTSTGHLELENNSTVHGGVTVQPGGELDLGHTIGSNTDTFTPNTIDGGIDSTKASDIDLDNATVNGSVDITGPNGSSSSLFICGSTLHGSVTITGINGNFGPSEIGDPGEPSQTGPVADCPANSFDGGLTVTGSRLIEIESNTIHGSVSINSTMLYELAGNTITGSASCTGSTTFTDGDHTANNVNGSDTCP